jgi:hypothetical protein
MAAACQDSGKEIEDRHFVYLVVDAAVDVGQTADREDHFLLGGAHEEGGMHAEYGCYEHESLDGRTRNGLPRYARKQGIGFLLKGPAVKAQAVSPNRMIAAAQIGGDGSTFAPTPFPERDTVSA